MADEIDINKMSEDTAKGVSRRSFIKGVITSGVAVSSANYLFRASTLQGQPAAGVGERLITLTVNGQQRRVDVMKQETLAWTLRYKLGLNRHQAGLRPCRMRCLYRAHRRGAALFLLCTHPYRARQESPDYRRTGQS